jgi:hypothetical protein
MMARLTKQFLQLSALICLIALAVAFVIKEFFDISHYWFIIVTPLLTYLISIFSFIAATSKIAGKNFGVQISALFIIKFFSYLLITTIFFLLESTITFRIIFISFIFVIYLTNTIVLLSEILKYFKSDTKEH